MNRVSQHPVRWVLFTVLACSLSFGLWACSDTVDSPTAPAISAPDAGLKFGVSHPEIAGKVGRPVGEVELILNLGRTAGGAKSP